MALWALSLKTMMQRKKYLLAQSRHTRCIVRTRETSILLTLSATTNSRSMKPYVQKNYKCSLISLASKGPKFGLKSWILCTGTAISRPTWMKFLAPIARKASNYQTPSSIFWRLRSNSAMHLGRQRLRRLLSWIASGSAYF